MTLLNLLVVVPLLASVLIVCLPEQFKQYFKQISLGVSVVLMGVVTSLTYSYIMGVTDSMEVYHNWLELSLGPIHTYTVGYHLKIDGFNLALVALTAIIHFIAALSSFEISTKQKGYHSLLLVLIASIYGSFLAQNLFLFFVFFEFMLLPMYFLIGLWGGKNREYASIKFFIYTLVGSVLILLVIIGLFNGTVIETNTEILVHTLEYDYLADSSFMLPDNIFHTSSGSMLWGQSYRFWGFVLLLVGFAIKLPSVPVHTWLPDAHVEAPTAISVILAGILLKVGGYGLLRIAYPIFPEQALALAPFVAFFAVLSIIWGALAALAQADLKRLVAYSSVSHMGFVLLAIATVSYQGFQAAIYQMVSHGILSAMLFVLVGVLYSRTADRRIDSYQGLAHTMPQYTFWVAIAFFASLGLPLFSGFIGEFYSLSAAFGSKVFGISFAIFAGIGIVLGAAYFLYTFKRMWLGNAWQRSEQPLLDLSIGETVMLAVLGILTLLLGIFPKVLFSLGELSFQSLNFLN
jgi:NADH-quinone oxidoreductase subunit M